MQETSDSENGIDPFLIAEYQHFADSFWRTEELGEKRLNFFISLITAAVAGLVVLATSDSGFTDKHVQWLAFATGLALLLFGLSTLLRMLRRNEAADEYKAAMDLVRGRFTSHYALAGYEPFKRPAPGRPLRRLLTGGLAQTSALLNSMLAASITAIGLYAAASTTVLAVLAVLVFAASLVGQFLFIRMRHRRP